MLREAFANAQGALEEQVGESEGASSGYASATLAIIHQRQLFLGHIGNSRAYLVRGEGVHVLTRDHVDARGRPVRGIGLPKALRVDVGILAASVLTPTKDGSLILQSGDHIVLCSDGLLAQRPDGRGPLLDVAREMPRVLNDNQTPALEKARMLVSLAVGRKALDNVSVAVISLPRRRLPMPLIVGAITLLCLALAIGGSIVGAQILTPMPTSTPSAAVATPTTAPTTTITVPDTGKARIGSIQGPASAGGEALSRGGELLPGTRVETGAGGRIELLLTDGSFIYLGGDTNVVMLQVDREDDRSTTRLVLLAGRILIHQAGRGDSVEIVDSDENMLGILANNGTMAIAEKGGRKVLSCFVGNCELADNTLLREGDEVDVPTGGSVGGSKAIPPARYVQWHAQCVCLDSP